MRDRHPGLAFRGSGCFSCLFSSFSRAVVLAVSAVLACGDRDGVAAVGADGLAARVVGEDDAGLAHAVDQLGSLTGASDVRYVGVLRRAADGEEDGDGG